MEIQILCSIKMMLLANQKFNKFLFLKFEYITFIFLIFQKFSRNF
jgi:hypothetical protein